MSFLGGAAVGGMNLIEAKTVGSAVTSVTFSSLTGDTHLAYVIHGMFSNASGSAADLELIWNGTATSGTDMQRISGEGSSIAAVRVADQTQIAQASGSSDSTFFCYTWNETGLQRTFYSVCTQDVGASVINRTYAGCWDDTATEITSIQLLCNQTNGIDAGSRFYLYKLAVA